MGRIGTVQAAIGHVVDGNVRAVRHATAQMRRSTAEADGVRRSVHRRCHGIKRHRRNGTRLHVRLELSGGIVRTATGGSGGVGVDDGLAVVPVGPCCGTLILAVPCLASILIRSPVTSLVVTWIGIAAVSTTPASRIVLICWDVGVHLFYLSLEHEAAGRRGEGTVAACSNPEEFPPGLDSGFEVAGG